MKKIWITLGLVIIAAWASGFAWGRALADCDLPSGWNLIATQTDATPEELAEADECIQSIWLWNAADQEWNAWFPLADGVVGATDLYEVSAGSAYWAWCER